MARTIVRAITLASLCVLSGLAQAGAVTVAPVVVEIESPRKAVAVTLSNRTGKPISIQADTRIWRQVDGKDLFEATQDLLVVPPMAVIQPGAAQVFRVALRNPAPAATERTYRLILEDVAQVQPDGAMGIAFRYTHNLPVLVAPSGTIRAAVRYEACEGDAAKVDAVKPSGCVRLTNPGNKRVKIGSLTLAGPGWQETVQLPQAQNLLAGASREWLVPVEPAALAKIRSLQVFTAQGSAIEAAAAGKFHAHAPAAR